MSSKYEKVRKKYEFGWSWKLPNNVIVSAKFGTDIEESDMDPEDLFELNYEATKADMRKAIKDNRMLSEGFELLKDGYKKLMKIKGKNNEDD